MNYLVRCMFALIMVLVAASPLQDHFVKGTRVASSGTHLWWISKVDASMDSYGDISSDSAKNVMYKLFQHAATGGENNFQIAAAFSDQPIAVAADDDQVWVVFAAANHKMEVVWGATHFNPASELWFITPGGALQLCPSIVGESLESLAALNGELWAIVQGQPDARVLRGGQWNSVQLPPAINECQTRMLVVAGGALNAFGQAQNHSVKRFKRENNAWIESPLNAPQFSYAIDHSARLACVTGEKSSEQMLCIVEAGSTTAIASLPNRNQYVLGLGESFASLGQGGFQESSSVPQDAPNSASTILFNTTTLSLLPLGASAFMEPVELRAQLSTASRWYHLPILGVLSLGAIIAAFLVRALNSPLNPLEKTRSTESAVDSSALTNAPWTPFEKWRRFTATAIDMLPCAIASVVMFEADMESVLIPPLWSADIQTSFPYIAMVVAAIAFSMFEEITFGRSMGKRLMGGRVVSIHGEPAAWWQHIARNLLKGLVLLSPVLAIPSLLSPLGAGIPEMISRTRVEATEADLD